MLTRKPRKGDRIVYDNPHTEDMPKVYVVMGMFKNHDDIINIATLESYAKDGGHEEHTQVIWNHREGPNPWLTFEKPDNKPDIMTGKGDKL